MNLVTTFVVWISSIIMKNGLFWWHRQKDLGIKKYCAYYWVASWLSISDSVNYIILQSIKQSHTFFAKDFEDLKHNLG